MKAMKYIITGMFALIATMSFAQDAMTNIQPIVDKAMANCEGPIWGDTDADSAKAVQNYSLYLEYYKQVKDIKDNPEKQMRGFDAALVGWRYLFFNAPKARLSTMVNGVNMFKKKAKSEEDPELKEAYLDTMFAIWEVREQCWGSTADLNMRKAFDWYNYRKTDNEVFLFNMFNNTIDMFDKEEGTTVNDISSAFLYPWIGITYVGYTKGLLTEDDVFDVYERISDISEFNMEQGNDAGKYKGAFDKVQEFLNKYDVLTCDKIVPSAEKKYEAAKDDPENVLKVYKMLKAGKCYDAPFFLEVVEKVVETNPSAGLYKFLASKYRKDRSYSKAIEYTNLSMDMTESSEEKAMLTLQIARDYESKGDYSSARSYAYKAAELKPGWGDPYLMVGRLYASSGSKCGPGTGWDSQVVTWVAIDEWQRAKSIDPSVADEAQRLINKYYAYMPSKQDCFLRNETAGGSYYVGCWINKSTTIRCAE